MFAVKWRKQALAQLADLWNAAADRNAIAAASDVVDEMLRRAPLIHGESREGTKRLLYEGPLGVLYRVNNATRRVIVISVAPARRAP
jgi:plasmid stabilization system protein ParE